MMTLQNIMKIYILNKMEHLVISQKKILFNELFEDKFIQNVPHSPDISYSIKTLWAELKVKILKFR